MSAPELNNKVNVSISLIMALVLAAFSLGGVVTGILGLDSKIEDEVGGLRNDMNREILLMRKDFEEHKEYSGGRMKRLIDNHEAIHHKK